MTRLSPAEARAVGADGDAGPPPLDRGRPPLRRRAGPTATRAEMAGALLHDVGKIEAGLGTFGRVAATVVGPRTRRFRLYHDHEAIGAGLAAGGRRRPGDRRPDRAARGPAAADLARRRRRLTLTVRSSVGRIRPMLTDGTRSGGAGGRAEVVDGRRAAPSTRVRPPRSPAMPSVGDEHERRRAGRRRAR